MQHMEGTYHVGNLEKASRSRNSKWMNNKVAIDVYQGETKWSPALETQFITTNCGIGGEILGRHHMAPTSVEAERV